MSDQERKGLMMLITDQISLCQKDYHIQIYKLIFESHPELNHTSNKNGIFIDLSKLSIKVLKKIIKIIQYSLDQKSNHEKRTKIKKKLILKNCT